jgi:uncharacterized protein YlxW (UPF0749 family)
MKLDGPVFASALLLVVCAGAIAQGIVATSKPADQREVQALREQVAELQKRVSTLESRFEASQSPRMQRVAP